MGIEEYEEEDYESDLKKELLARMDKSGLIYF